MLAFSSVCGPATSQNAMELLKFNTQMVHGAFAVESSAAGDVIVVRANQLTATAEPLRLPKSFLPSLGKPIKLKKNFRHRRQLTSPRRVAANLNQPRGR